jgi:TetR/AcrR family transcriptional repressor of lmrAB and yxaGH operons
MRDDVREKMVLGAMRLLATSGLEGVSFSTVLELTGAPRGSIYHHFPEGKNQLIGLAVGRAGQYLLKAKRPLSPLPSIFWGYGGGFWWTHIAWPVVRCWP